MDSTTNYLFQVSKSSQIVNLQIKHNSSNDNKTSDIKPVRPVPYCTIRVFHDKHILPDLTDMKGIFKNYQNLNCAGKDYLKRLTLARMSMCH